MGWLDKWLGKLRSSATKAAGEYAAKKALDKAKGSVEALGEDFLQFAEGELEAAEKERDASQDVVERVRTQAEEEHRDRKAARVEREERARRELAALKAAHAKEEESD